MEINIHFKEKRFVAAKFGKVYGLSGWLNIINFLTTSDDIAKFSRFYINGNKAELLFKKKGKKVICKIEGINNIDNAKPFIGKEILIDKDELPKLEQGQYYYNELLGLSVWIEKKKIGEIVDIQNHGAGDYLIIKKKKDEILVPLIKDHVIRINIKEKILNLNPDYYEF